MDNITKNMPFTLKVVIPAKNIREQILDAIDFLGTDCSQKCNIEYDSCYKCPIGLEYANAVLAIPDIKEALELLELKRQGKLAKLVDDQTIPNNGRCEDSCDSCIKHHNRTFKSAGFKKVIPL